MLWLDLVDLRFVDLGVDLHLADVGQAEDLLTLANRRPFLDLRLAAAEGPVGIVGVDDQPVAGARILQAAICLSSFFSLLSSSSQVAFLASSSDWAFSTSLLSSLIVLPLV